MHLGAFDRNGNLFHVFDEVALDAVLRTLDTVTDFCDYLKKREKFFRHDWDVLAAGEEELLGFYLNSTTEDGHDFLTREIIENEPTRIFIDESFWDSWIEGPQRKTREEANRISYCWDRLVEKFVFHMKGGTQYFVSEGGLDDLEIIVRWMARESRLHRRILAESLLEAMNSTKVGEVRRRYSLPQKPGDPYWAFLVMPRLDELSYQRYRELRRQSLIGQCYVIKYLHPEALDIVGIAVDPNPKEISEDAIHMDARTWTIENNNIAKGLHEEIGIFRNPRAYEIHAYESPIDVDT
jgi:hypothetical protein